MRVLDDPQPLLLPGEEHPRDAAALIHPRGSLSHGELRDRVDDRRREFGAGRKLVAIVAGHDVEAVISYLACLEGGHVAWMLPPGAADRLRLRLPPDITMHGADLHRTAAAGDDGRYDMHPELALLLSTSGSTGSPKMVRLSRGNVLSNAAAIGTYLSLRPDDRAMLSLPLHYCYGLSVLNSHLLAGASVVITDRPVVDAAYWDLFAATGATSFAGVPQAFQLLEESGFADRLPQGLRFMTQAGGRLDPAAVRRFAARGRERGFEFFVMYGQTEATARMAYLPPSLAESAPECIGTAIPGGSLEIRDRRDGVGELVYTGPNVMMGYAEGPADLALGHVTPELRTGDLARRRQDGLIEIVGRRSRFLKIFGHRIDLDQLERDLRRDGLTAACAGTDDSLVVAVESARPLPCIGPALAGRLGIPAARVAVLAVPTLPRTESGKADYGRVMDLYASKDVAEQAAGARADVAPPGADATRAIITAYRDALGVRDVTANDTFSELGGDSLSYVEVSLALERIVGQVPPDWPQRAIRDLAAEAPMRSADAPAPSMARMETNVLLRAAAIMLVVAQHMTGLWPQGGAHLLLGLAGFSFARFQLGAVGAGIRVRQWWSTIARIAIPSSLWIGLQVLVATGYSVGAALLVNNYVGSVVIDDNRWDYWFIEALVQILIVLAVLFSIPAVRRLERARPFAFALGLLVLALLPRFDVLALRGEGNFILRPHAVVWIFLLGWLIQRASTRGERLLASVVVLATVPEFFNEPLREGIIAGGLLLLAWVPSVPVPRMLTNPIALVASASLFIYLTHWQAWPPLVGIGGIVLGYVATIAVGIGAWWVAREAEVRITAAMRRARACPHCGGAHPASRQAG